MFPTNVALRALRRRTLNGLPQTHVHKSRNFDLYHSVIIGAPSASTRAIEVASGIRSIREDSAYRSGPPMRTGGGGRGFAIQEVGYRSGAYALRSRR